MSDQPRKNNAGEVRLKKANLPTGNLYISLVDPVYLHTYAPNMASVHAYVRTHTHAQGLFVPRAAPFYACCLVERQENVDDRDGGFFPSLVDTKIRGH